LVKRVSKVLREPPASKASLEFKVEPASKAPPASKALQVYRVKPVYRVLLAQTVSKAPKDKRDLMV
jgi:hypothetical protein